MIGEFKSQIIKFVKSRFLENNCEVVEIAADQDHVHALIRFDHQKSIPQLIKDVKGSSAFFVNKFLEPDTRFRWKRGYGIRSVGPKELLTVSSYIRRHR